jgi:hypothetical protein
MIVNQCQGTSGTGCADIAFFDMCGPTCAVGVASGCNPRGPKTPTAKSIESDIDRLVAKQAHAAFVTCAEDNSEFEKWLARTNSVRNAQP